MRGRRRASTAVIAALAMLLAACATASPSPEPSGPMVVTLGIYSGRPDPSWTLTPSEAAGLEAVLAPLRVVTDAPPAGGLGYRGYTITTPARTLVAFGGAIAAPGQGPRAMKLDPTLSVERYLLETSRSRVTPDEFAAVQAAIGAP